MARPAPSTHEAEDVARWLATAYGLGRPVGLTQVARGAMGEVHRLLTSTGRYAAKRYFWGEDRLPHAEFSEAFAQRCRGIGVAAPQAVRTRSGGLLVRDGAGNWWQLAQWLPGTKAGSR